KEDFSVINFHKFVDESLAQNGYKILLITEKLMNERLDDFMNFINGIRKEYSSLYSWAVESKEYFLNGLCDKWKFSYAITDDNNRISFVNFSSVYKDIIHNHCTYAGKNTRGLNFAKLHIIKLCQTGLDNGFTHQEGYWPKNNNGSIILFLKMGWEIQSIRNNRELFMIADLEKVRNRTYGLLINQK
ncbi:MAG: hypothetical protein ACM34M_09005, partial [Ignavibacteria bacterium]